MDQGLITNPKDLERMQGELVSLQRRIGDLEDIELEIMEKLEEAQADLDEIAARIDNLDVRAAELTTARDAKAAELGADLADVSGRRTPIADALQDDLLALYEKLRAQKGGVGAAALRARRCGGCSLDLNAADMAVIAKAPADEVIRCEECNRILVRTSESGI
ncbi:MAG: C4-type zinc ribbon domain-containing protein [Nocardioides sp.]